MRATRDRLCTFVVRAAEYKFGFKKKKKNIRTAKYWAANAVKSLTPMAERLLPYSHGIECRIQAMAWIQHFIPWLQML
jgi:hypothetical protein